MEMRRPFDDELLPGKSMVPTLVGAMDEEQKQWIGFVRGGGKGGGSCRKRGEIAESAGSCRKLGGKLPKIGFPPFTRF